VAYGATPSQSVGPELPEESIPELWRTLTERVELPQPTQKFSGFGTFQPLTIERLGIIAEATIHVLVEADVKVAAKWSCGTPWNIVKNISLQANGVSGVISCSGAVLEARQKAVYRGPTHPILKGELEAGHEYAIGTEVELEFIIQVPISEDMSEETQLALQITWASEAELLEAGSLEEVEGTVKWHVTWFSIGTAATKKGERVIVLPDLTELHGLVEREQEVGASSGEKEAPLTRASGDLLRYFVTVRNGAHKCVDPATKWTKFQLKFGGNQTPITYADVPMLVERNARDYRVSPYVGNTGTNGPIKYVIVDTTLDDAIRDAIRPLALSELKGIVGLVEAPETGSALVSAQENLYPQNT
jgi:hypothetical protein